MLELKNIVKDYLVSDNKVEALRGVSIRFRKSEFVSVLGPSGCGKTTLLNIIGGLDHYTSGDLIIREKSTKDFSDKDWDSYRNNSIGFVFQSYNLIPHQSVLANVELALTLSGVSKGERKKRAEDALVSVGLADQIHKKPNQLSGGQMQRVAIARALVNDPDILLADEPTGALDSETSIQIMEILKKISQNRLIVMVTHNPALAEQYSSRIVKLLDGKIVGDSMPYEGEGEKAAPEKTEKKQSKKERKKVSMSFFTALSLSLNNLMTKKARTFLTSFAGSIGIIGIALILAMSSGAQSYITRVERETLSSYPISITEQTVDYSELMSMMSSMNENGGEHGDDKVYSHNVMGSMMNTMLAEVTINNMSAFKDFLDSDDSGLDPYVNDIQYGYSTVMNVYRADTEKGLTQVNPATLFEKLGMMGRDTSSTSSSMSQSYMSNYNVWAQLYSNKELLDSQYDVVEGRMPESYDEAVLILDKNNEVPDYTLYTLGIMDDTELMEMMKGAMSGEAVEKKDYTQSSEFSYSEILSQRFRMLINTDYYVKENGIWVDKSEDEAYVTEKLSSALEIKIVGILRPDEGSVQAAMTGVIGYMPELSEYLVNAVNDSEIVKEQLAAPETNVFTGEIFYEGGFSTMEELYASFEGLSDEERAKYDGIIQSMRQSGAGDEKILESFSKMAESEGKDATYKGNLTLLGVSDLESPSVINIYPKDFEAKDKIIDIINEYNDGVGEEDKIQYTDYVGTLMSSITTIINAISYILIGFVAVSLVVSSIMIGIITYISVLERTKEIGILRSIGASKRDISRVFNAETLIVGFSSGVIGIAVTLLLLLPINAIINSLADIGNIASLPVAGAVILVVISMVLTLISGLFPSRVAAKKDPVEALRSE